MFLRRASSLATTRRRHRVPRQPPQRLRHPAQRPPPPQGRGLRPIRRPRQRPRRLRVQRCLLTRVRVRTSVWRTLRRCLLPPLRSTPPRVRRRLLQGNSRKSEAKSRRRLLVLLQRLLQARAHPPSLISPVTVSKISRRPLLLHRMAPPLKSRRRVIEGLRTTNAPRRPLK